MAREPTKNREARPRPRFMYSTEASRAQKLTTPDTLRRPAGATPQSSPVSKRNHLFQRATYRLTSLSTGKGKESRIGRSPLSISSPIPQRPARPSSLRLSSPSRLSNNLPEPVKKDPLSSPTSTNKPLPSLPVATLVSRSPIQRRSLIDATEKPLRKSVSPNIIQDWPALSPARPNGKTRSPEDHIMEKEKPTLSAPKPSLGESLIARMRKLNLDSDDNGQQANVGTQSRIKNQNNTSGFISRPRKGQANTSATLHESTFLNPRPAPEAPLAKQERLSSGPSIDRRASLQGLKISKIRAAPYPTESQLRSTSDRSQSRPTSVVAPNPLFSCSSIPRPLQAMPAAGSPSIETAHSSPKVNQLKRARGQVGDRLQSTSPLEDARQPETPCPKAPNRHADRTSADSRRSSLPLPERLIRPTRGEADDHKSAGSPAVKRESSLEPEAKLEQFSPASFKTIKQESDDDSLMRTFRFPHTPPEDIADDSRSVVSRSRSVSSATSGTIYAYDQFGSFRLKPVSVSDPKHGPRVRIEDSADHLLLDDESLAKCNAKREAYEKRYKPVTSGDANEKDIPELAGLRTVSEGSKDAERQIEERNDSIGSDATVITNTTNTKNALDIRGGKRLAPPIPVNIPSLSHSPTGWPLLVSKIAPFAELGPREESPKSADKRKSASESNLRSASATPSVTPVKNIQNFEEQSPASAYTLRTALSKGPCGSLIKKTRRSFPNIAAARPLFPPRTSSKINAIDSPSTRTITGHRKQNSGVLESYVSQRAEFKSSPPGDKQGDGQNTTQFQQQAQVTSVATPSPPHHMQSYNDSIRIMGAHEDIDANLPSSPIAISGSVNAGKAVMSNIKGLFHKHSSDKMVKSETNGSLHLPRNTPTRNASEAFKPSPLRAMFDPSTPDTAKSRKTAVNSSVKRKFPRLHRDKFEEHKSPNNATAQTQSESSQPFMTSALEPLEIRDATALAFTLLDKARDVANPEMQHDYVELAKLLVSTVTLSREAEKAMEEARQAAARAEMETLKTRQGVTEVTVKIREMLAKQAS